MFAMLCVQSSQYLISDSMAVPTSATCHMITKSRYRSRGPVVTKAEGRRDNHRMANGAEYKTKVSSTYRFRMIKVQHGFESIAQRETISDYISYETIGSVLNNSVH